MHTKLKHVILGLAFSALAIAGGALLGEPASAPFLHCHVGGLAQSALLAAAPSKAKPTQESVQPSDVTRPAAPHQAISPALPWNTQALRASFQMPFFSFGAILPRAPISQEQ